MIKLNKLIIILVIILLNCNCLFACIFELYSIDYIIYKSTLIAEGKVISYKKFSKPIYIKHKVKRFICNSYFTETIHSEYLDISFKIIKIYKGKAISNRINFRIHILVDNKEILDILNSKNNIFVFLSNRNYASEDDLYNFRNDFKFVPTNFPRTTPLYLFDANNRNISEKIITSYVSIITSKHEFIKYLNYKLLYYQNKHKINFSDYTGIKNLQQIICPDFDKTGCVCDLIVEK